MENYREIWNTYGKKTSPERIVRHGFMDTMIKEEMKDAKNGLFVGIGGNRPRLPDEIRQDKPSVEMLEKYFSDEEIDNITSRVKEVPGAEVEVDMKPDYAHVRIKKGV